MYCIALTLNVTRVKFGIDTKGEEYIPHSSCFTSLYSFTQKTKH